MRKLRQLERMPCDWPTYCPYCKATLSLLINQGVARCAACGALVEVRPMQFEREPDA